MIILLLVFFMNLRKITSSIRKISSLSLLSYVIYKLKINSKVSCKNLQGKDCVY